MWLQTSVTIADRREKNQPPLSFPTRICQIHNSYQHSWDKKDKNKLICFFSQL